ncbi:MAG: (d)CMP kinase [Ruminococcaceae bacterium]|nr:(d)CMP kinase [Oscillospiraceae bacterium]
MDIKKIRIALDGPSGAGKSTVAKAIAARMGIVYVDTGALYRTVGLWVMQNGVASDDVQGIIALLPSVEIELLYRDGEQVVLLHGEPVGNKIRTPEASMYASAVSKIPEVREKLLGLQKDLAAKGGVIMDGRDIGTVIIPDAELKVFMTATLAERARRRYKELCEKDMETTYEEVLADMEARDKNDRERESAPCVPAEDAVQFVNDGYNVEESAEYIIALAEKKAAELQ